MTTTDLKNRLIRTSLRERERAVCRLVLDTASTFTLTARFISRSCGFSLERTWPRVRDSLINHGLLIYEWQRPIPLRPVNYRVLDGGQKCWYLNFDFTPLALGTLDQVKVDPKLSTSAAKRGGSRARACDPPQQGGSRDPLLLAGSRDPATKAGLELEVLEQEKPTTKEVVAFCLTEKQLKGFSQSELSRVNEALGEATPVQRNTFIQIFTRCRAKARDPVGLAVSLARFAAKGELQLPLSLKTETPGQTARSICDDHGSWRGELCDPTGVQARAVGDFGGQLRDPAGDLLTLTASAAAWQRVDAGELDFVST